MRGYSHVSFLFTTRPVNNKTSSEARKMTPGMGRPSSTFRQRMPLLAGGVISRRESKLKQGGRPS